MDISRLLPIFTSLRGQAQASPAAMLKENLELGNKLTTMTAIFTGATHGIGLATLEAFVRHIPKPKAFIIGRSRARFDEQLHALQALNADAELVFLEYSLSLIRDVDRVRAEIQERLPSHSVDLLCMSHGYAPIGGRIFTEEDLDEAMTLVVYGRMRLAESFNSNGLMAENARIVSVAGGGKEGHLFEDDLELKSNYSIANLRGHFTTVTTLAFDILAQTYPDKGFVHVYPGTVSTGLLSRGTGGLTTKLMLRSIELVTSFFAMSAAESGERTLWAATTDEFGKGSYSINYDGALSQSRELTEYRQDRRKARLVWEHLQQLFERASQSAVRQESESGEAIAHEALH